MTTTTMMVQRDVLDHGYVRMVEAWGSDERIVEAARMSTGKGFQGWGPLEFCKKCGIAHDSDVRTEYGCDRLNKDKRHDFSGDEKLLKFLYDYAHMTPFEMAGMVIEVQAPIFVFREWHRHRTQSYNEMSARYTPLPDVNYVPSIERLMTQSSANKQAQSTGAALTEAAAEEYRAVLPKIYAEQQRAYENFLHVGVPKELARIHLPVGRYSKMRASANLRNWLAFLTLRMAPNAQWEIQQYANAVGEIIAERFPRTWELFHGAA